MKNVLELKKEVSEDEDILVINMIYKMGLLFILCNVKILIKLMFENII